MAQTKKKIAEIKPARGSYPISIICHSLQLVLSAGCSLRGVERVLQVTFSSLGIDSYVPDWTTVRSWLLRLGLAQLRQPVEQADDWIWMVDCSVQIGVQKVLVIVGVRASLIEWNRSLRYEDLTLISMQVLNQAKKEDILRCLEQACRDRPMPTAILSDHGADILAGVRLLQNSHSEVRDLYDVKHKTACMLKAALTNDDKWQSFQTALGQSKFKTQQTLLAYATAPSQRSKARFMNLAKLVRWAKRVLWHLDSGKRTELSQDFKTQFQWVQEYRDSIEQWSQWLAVIEQTLDLIRREGLHSTTPALLESRLSEFGLGAPISTGLARFVTEESQKLHSGERVPMTTEVLESLFSKLKNIEKTQEKSGFSSLVLTLGAMIPRLTKESTLQALETTSNRSLKDWAKKTLGTTVQAARQAFFRTPKAQQN